MLDNIKDMKVSGQRHCGWQGQPGGEDQGGLQNQDVSLQLGFSSSRMRYAVVMLIDINFFLHF